MNKVFGSVQFNVLKPLIENNYVFSESTAEIIMNMTFYENCFIALSAGIIQMFIQREGIVS